MNKKPEITWSLMHPTPLDAEYMKTVVKKAATYRVESFEICADCHTNLGGMDGLTDYAEFPNTAISIDQQGIRDNIQKLKEILAIAHSINKPVYYWHREAMVPDGLLTDMPDLLDENGEFDLLGSAYEKLLRYKIASSFQVLPELDGLVLTLTEATYSVIHSSNQEKYPAEKVVEHIVRIFAGELQKRSKRFILRSFGSIAKDYEDILAGAGAAAGDFEFEIETKITPYDFDPFLPVNPFLRKLPGATLGAECDALGEFLGAGILPAENVDNIVNYVRTGQKAGVDRYAIRLDRIGNRIFDCYEVNLYAYHRAIDDENITAEEIRKEFLAMHAPAGQREIFARMDIEGLELVKKNNFIDGNVIFHQFPTQKSLKYLKAGFIFALFKEKIPLANGSGVWSILWENTSPTRKELMAEKQQAVEIARKNSEILAALSPEPGFESALAWRKKLWANAVIATRAFYWLCSIICSYFDHMEQGDGKAELFRKTVKDGQAELSRLAGFDLQNGQKTGEKFVNGLGQNLFRAADDPVDIYLDQFHAIFALLEKEFDIEFAMRKKYAANAIDCIICGGITDEWRIKRYMHAGHATINDQEIFRFAGNTVFPNGFLEMVLNAPAGSRKLEIFGDITETAEFCLEMNHGEKIRCSFDADGKISLPLNSTEDWLTVKLSKAPGEFFPRFRAVRITG